MQAFHVQPSELLALELDELLAIHEQVRRLSESHA